MEELKQLQVKLGPNKVKISDSLVMYISTNSSDVKHCWFSGRILACHAGDRGSIPRQCIYDRAPKIASRKLFHQI